jgi:hypothetical protein
MNASNRHPNRILDFYAEPGVMTDAGLHERRLNSLPDEIKPLMSCVQNLFLYDFVAKEFYDFDVPKHREGEIHLRSTESLIDRILQLNDAPLTQKRTLEQRVIGRCDHHTRFMVAALRAHNIPARVRCGFAAYFNHPKFEDHQVCEYWDEQQEKWLLADPLLDDIWIKQLPFAYDPADVPRDQFLTAADAWRQCRKGKHDANLFGIEFDNLRGLWFIAAALIHDAAALNKVEMLPWDNWGAQPKPNASLTKFELALFDELAEMTAHPDESFDDLYQLYEDDDRIRVPDSVYNALTHRLLKSRGGYSNTGVNK